MTLQILDFDGLLTLQQDVLEKIVRRVDLQTVLDDLCRMVEEVIPDSVCSIMQLDPATGSLRVRASPCVPPGLVEELNGLVPSELAGSCGAAVYTGEMVIVEDTMTDPRWADMRDTAAKFGIRSCWSVPFFSGTGEVLGSFAISHFCHRSPEEMHLRLLRMGGFLVGIAVERDRAEAELQGKQELLDRILECTEDPVFAKDREGRYLVVNPAAAHCAGTEPGEMIGRSDDGLFPPETARWFREVDERILATGRGEHHEDVIEVESGPRSYLTRKNPLRSSDGRITGLVGIARDVTELRHAEEALQRAQKLESLGVLAGGIAHDFNNLLTGVLGHAELAEQRIACGEPAEHNLREIQRAADRAAELVNQMLAYAGRADAAKTAVDLEHLVEEVGALLASSISKKTELRFEFGEGVPPVEADPAQLRQVVMNLITNASEALGDEPGRVIVSIGSSDGAVRLVVRDSGCGMDAETRARIFDPFFTTKFTGRGLGLAAVQGIVRGHDGQIEVGSRPGCGTAVTVLLPATDRSVEPASSSGARSSRGAGRVLVVDDEETVRTLAAEALGSAGFSTVSAADGAEAVALLEQDAGHVDAVLLDLTMPRLPGRAAFDRLRALRPGIPVILASGFDEREATRDFGANDLAGFVKKPFRPSMLVEMVRAAVSC